MIHCNVLLLKKTEAVLFCDWPQAWPPEFRCCCIDNNGKILVELLSRLAPSPRGCLNLFPVTMAQIRVRGSLLLLLASSALSSGSGAQRQYFIREPDNQTAIEGEQVIITRRGSQSSHCSVLISNSLPSIIQLISMVQS